MTFPDWRRFSWRPVRARPVVALGMLLFIAATLALAPCHYAINDDVAILLDIQDGHDVSFFGLLLGRALAFLGAHVSRTLPWYALTLYLAHWLGLFVFLDAMAKSKRARLVWLPLLLFYLPTYFLFLVRINYSTASMMAGIQSILAFQLLLRSPRPSARTAVWLGLVFALSLLIRWQAWLMVCLFALPVLLATLGGRLARLRLAVLFLAGSLVAFAASALVAKFAVPPDYKRHAELTELMHRPGVFVPVLPPDPEVLKTNGWSAEDYALFRVYFFPDEEKFNARTFQRLADAATVRLSKTWALRLLPAVRSAVASGVRFTWAIAALAAIVFLALSRRKSLLLGTYLLGSLLAMAMLETLFYLPEHIAAPVWLLLLLVPISTLLGERERWRPRWRRLALHALAGTLLLFGIAASFTASSEVGRDAADQALAQTQRARLSSHYRGTTLLWMCCGLHPELWSALRPLPTEFTLVMTGWQTFSPRNYALLEQKLGVRSARDMLPAMIDNPHAFLVAPDSAAELLVRQARASHGLGASFVKVDDLGSFGVYSLQGAGMPGEPSRANRSAGD
jgi:hypothetical protein